MDKSPFGKLPPELRNRIYTLAMSGEKTITFAPQVFNAKRTGLKPLASYHRPPQGLSLTATCRQMRQESSMLFYANNDFAFVRDIDTLKTFVRKIRNRNARALRSVTIKVFADVHLDAERPTGPYLKVRKAVCEYGKLAKRYGWTSAKGEIKFESLNEASERLYATLDVADRGEPWDRFISEVDWNIVTSGTHKRRHFFLGVKNEVQIWRMLLTAS